MRRFEHTKDLIPVVNVCFIIAFVEMSTDSKGTTMYLDSLSGVSIERKVRRKWEEVSLKGMSTHQRPNFVTEKTFFRLITKKRQSNEYSFETFFADEIKRNRFNPFKQIQYFGGQQFPFNS